MNHVEKPLSGQKSKWKAGEVGMIYVITVWILLGGLFGGLVQIVFDMQDTDEFSYNTAFWFVTHFYETYSDQINSAGIIVAIVFISVLILPGSLLIIALVTLSKLFSAFWKAFKFAFRKRRDNTNES